MEVFKLNECAIIIDSATSCSINENKINILGAVRKNGSLNYVKSSLILLLAALVGRVLRALSMADVLSSINRFSLPSLPKASVSISVRILCRRTDSCNWYMSDMG